MILAYCIRYCLAFPFIHLIPSIYKTHKRPPLSKGLKTGDACKPTVAFSIEISDSPIPCWSEHSLEKPHFTIIEETIFLSLRAFNSSTHFLGCVISCIFLFRFNKWACVFCLSFCGTIRVRTFRLELLQATPVPCIIYPLCSRLLSVTACDWYYRIHFSGFTHFITFTRLLLIMQHLHISWFRKSMFRFSYKS